MTSLEELLGLDPHSPDLLRAEMLADNDRELLRALVEVRRARHLSQRAVGEIMGVSQASVSQFEDHDSNPTLATIRRYAHAVGALIAHKVEADKGQLLDPSQRTGWLTSSVKDIPADEMARITRSHGAATFRLPLRRDNIRAELALAA